jgi:PhzF family phenazine biosynthesis protein
MTRIPLHQIDAFAEKPFTGNPAAVCPLEAWLDDALMQAVAAENNLSETAFFVPGADAGRFDLRWFTPAVEVKLCGHATLASAHVIFTKLGFSGDAVRFDTLSGPLTVTRADEGYAMDFPSLPHSGARPPDEIVEAVGGAVEEAYEIPKVHGAAYCLMTFPKPSDVAALKPDLRALGTARTNIIATAPGETHDFVSRFFGPGSGVDEDPVTGSAHCTLAPYWAERLGKTRMRARQISARGGELTVEQKDGRTVLIGRCADYMSGEIVLA